MSFHRIDLLSGLREQLELNERVNENLPMDDIIILERDKTSGDFSRLMSSVGYPEFRDHLGSGNLILILADERYLNPPPLTMVCDIFHTWNIPAQDYIDMIASFFPPHRLSQSPKVLRPTTYIESATDLRFPTGAPNRGFPWERIPPTVCYQLYFVDDQRAPKSRPALTPLPCRARATVPLNDEPKIHKSAVLVQPRADRVIVTTTHRDIISVFQRPPSNSLPFRDLFSDPLEEWVSSSHSQWLENSYDERLPVSAAQFTLAQFGSVGWDLCLNWIETSVERLREALSPSEGHEDVKEQSQGWDELWECLARLQRRRGDILKFMMANITVISAMERNSSDRYSRRNTGHSNSKELSWTLMHFRNRLQRQIDRAAIIEKSIELEMNRVRSSSLSHTIHPVQS
ncbi:hypothetical protein BKA56DRAFT_613670 [Ilyonectria sp. MPI-CAGE-AT-0026]|nr:hypothetical protein BKA56DRAFT_613670 [Ilyonectria sp. MPI-CAGE-AT-0026]